jgi:hypothetical protein
MSKQLFVKNDIAIVKGFSVLTSLFEKGRILSI